MKKFAYFIVILLVLGGGYYLYVQNNRQALAPSEENGQSAQNIDESAGADKKEETPKQDDSGVKVETGTEVKTGAGQSEGTFSGGEGDILAPDVLVVQVDYDGAKFSPASVDIKVGDIVIFKNNGDVGFWPASANHPMHTLYPEFDAKQSIAPGGKWQFKFEKVGAWKYHDHLNPSATGVINVASK